jgi:hypothetical protein
LGAASLTDHTKSFRQNIFFAGCDAFLLMKRVIEGAGMRLGYQDLARSFRALKQQALVSATLNGARYGGPADTRDGAALVQAFTYDPSRKSFVYVGRSLSVA